MKQEKRRKRDKHNESLTYTVEVKDKEGRVLQRISAPSRSFVEQWNQVLYIQASQNNWSVRRTDGTSSSQSPHQYNFRSTTILARGIRVGRGSTPVAIDDYALEAVCEDGTGTNEFNHQGMVKVNPSVIGSTCSFTWTRIMVNNSGATISDINEIGNYIGAGAFLGFRDVLPSTVSVPNGGSITVTYTMSVTV